MFKMLSPLRLLGCAVVGVLLLAGCSAATLQTNLQKINADIATFNTNLNADIAVLSAQGLPALCTTATILDAGFKDAAALNQKVAANSATEAAAMAIVAGTCKAPPTDAASLAAAVVAIVPQVQAIQAAAK